MSDQHNTHPTTPPITDPEASPADSSIDEISTDTESTGSEDPGSEVDQAANTSRLPGKRPDDRQRGATLPVQGVPK